MSRAHLLIGAALALGLAAPTSADAQQGARLLKPVAQPAGVAIARWQLPSGAVVQLHSGCNEWSGGGGAVLVLPGGQRVVEFPAGPAASVGPVLIVESRRQIGGDATGEPVPLPPGVRAGVWDSAGSVFATQVLVVHARWGTLHRAGRDTFAPMALPHGRYLVAARAAPASPEAYVRFAEREAVAWIRVDVATGRVTPVGPAHGVPSYRRLGREVIVELKGGASRAIHVDTGRARFIPRAAAEAAAPATLDLLSGPSLARPPQLPWRDAEGRRLVLPDPRRPGQHQAPQHGQCGVSGAWWAHGLVFTDQGVFRWPAGAAAPGATR